MSLSIKNNLKEKFKKISKTAWILLAIVLLGAFLRSYNLRSWLDFGSDQVKDFNIVNSVVNHQATWPLLGPDMSHSGAGGYKPRFLLGPMFYYFEIISATIFGPYPDRLAYPDLLFSILSIPLFYYFLKKYFSSNLSLSLTGIYAISFYALSFSHSAWNVNSIPFFILLFLLSLYEFIIAKEKTHWVWIILLGISLGVGVQLHAILLVLFPVTVFFAIVSFMRKNRQAWKKLAIIIIIAVILNLGQIISEQKTGYRNSKLFLISLNKTSPIRNGNSILIKVARDIDFHVQANLYILSSIGHDTCDFSISGAFTGVSGMLEAFSSPSFVMKLVSILLFSLFGYGLLLYYFWKEKEEKRKQFLGMIILYSALSFFVFLPLNVNLFRYFAHVFFIPVMFLGFIIQYLVAKFPKKISSAVVILLLMFFAASNIISIWNTARVYAAKNRTDLDIIVLGELESALDYMTDSNGRKEVYLLEENGQRLFLGSLNVIAKEKNIQIVIIDDSASIPEGVPIFIVGPSSEKNSEININNYSIEDHKDYGRVGIYRMKYQAQ